MAAGARRPALVRAIADRVRRFLPTRPAILMYHRIARERFDPWGLAVSPENFADQLQWLARNRTALPLAEFAALNRAGRLPRNAIALTFDDGYACNLETAAPLLERFNAPATIFLPAALIEKGGEFWWDELQRIVLEHDGPSLRLGHQEVMIGPSDTRDCVWAAGEEPRTARQHAYRTLWARLHAMRPSERDAAMAQLRSHERVPDQPRHSPRPMSAEEIRKNRSDLITFGSHALTHVSLPALPAEAKATEILGSMEHCAALIGARPRAFAYPYGDWDAQSELLAEKAGFECACTTESGFVGRKSRSFALPRLYVGDWSSRRLARLLGAA